MEFTTENLFHFSNSTSIDDRLDAIRRCHSSKHFCYCVKLCWRWGIIKPLFFSFVHRLKMNFSCIACDRRYKNRSANHSSNRIYSSSDVDTHQHILTVTFVNENAVKLLQFFFLFSFHFVCLLWMTSSRDPSITVRCLVSRELSRF